MIAWNITWWVLITAGAVYGTLCMSLSMILRNGGRSAIERRLAERGRDTAWNEMEPRRPFIAHAAALQAWCIAIAWLVLWVVDFSGLPGSDFSIAGFFVGIGTGAFFCWLALDLVATAIARHGAPATVSACFPLVRLLSVWAIFISWLSRFVDEVVRRLSGANLESSRNVGEAEAELLRSIEQTHREGGLDEGAVALLENVVEFSSTDVGEVMTPRTDIDGLEYTDDLAEIRRMIGEVGHSRIPVYDEDLDHIAGILYAKDLVRWLGEEAQGFTLRPLLRRPIVVPESKQVADLLADFQRSEVHMAMVVDEYGGTAGLVTIEDVLEEIVGEIVDEHEPDDEEQPSLRPMADGIYEVDGNYHIDDLNEALEIGLPEDEEYDTVGGWLMACIGHVPETGESHDENGHRFTATATTPTQVERISIESRDSNLD
jgi:CBS domain containing-hemolysin-like protein